VSFTVVIGAGPGGLAAAWELSARGHRAVVLEQDAIVGGIARTVNYRGYRFDIGGHRFFSKVSRVREMWEDLLGDDFLERERMSRIYYGGRFFHYPLRPMSALLSLGPIESRWGSNGALCISHLRLWSTDGVCAASPEQPLVERIQHDCNIPACDESQPCPEDGASSDASTLWWTCTANHVPHGSP